MILKIGVSLNKDLIIYQEKDYYFGIFPEDFESHVSLDQLWINPTKNATSIWYFKDINKKKEGYCVHIGGLLGFSPVHFSYKGYIFTKELSDINFGVLMDNFIKKVPIRDKQKDKIPISEIQDLPKEIPISTFEHVIIYGKMNVLVINPEIIFKTAQL